MNPDRTLRQEALRFIIALGLLSLFADMVYEGARSILGPFLVTLGASAAAVEFISGVGEFVGYGLRVAAGYLADRTQRYWALTIAGYLLTVVAVPLWDWWGLWTSPSRSSSRNDSAKL